MKESKLKKLYSSNMSFSNKKSKTLSASICVNKG